MAGPSLGAPRLLGVCLAFCLFGLRAACGVILLETADPQRNTTTPGDNSGWQYEGQFGAVLGTPIAPRFFVTAGHIGGSIGQPFTFHGETYTTTAATHDPSSDLQIWQVDHDFPSYAPLYQSGQETGAEVRVFGRGTQRGSERTLGGELRGWDWGPEDHLQRWGRNLVTRIDSDSNGVSYLIANFDSPGLSDEAHLSGGDSGGGEFILEDGLWKLAGVNYGVDDLNVLVDGAYQHFVAAVFDARGFYTQDAQGNYLLVPDDGSPVPTSFYGTRISARLDWIAQTIGQNPATLAPESFQNWLRLYFTPDEINDPTQTGPMADPDGDGIPNLLEFAFNLDPTFPAAATLTPGTGLSGLPSVRLETVGASDQRLTVEYIRRTAASGAGITYAAQFSSSLAPGTVAWQTSGTESVTPINARWERVKVTDSISSTGTSARFARVAVTLSP